ncbi:MAG: molybdenum cofactor guanylyltransferase [Ardenticatenaceae bacterium]|nr:molybdenum cofactor guanylyltransferase [Ardenticatenaceae bacterium]
MANNLTVAIMAGGQSSRMGKDKSFVLFEGRPMIEVVIDAVAGLGDEMLLITNKPDEYAHLNLPMVSDVYPDHGSLGGIFTAVYAASHPHTLVVACDMPWLNRSLLEHMIALRESADVIVPRWEKYPEPLHAIYSKACLNPIEAKLKEKRLKITGFFGEVDVQFVDREEIERFDRNGRSFANINSPEDLEEASGQ